MADLLESTQTIYFKLIILQTDLVKLQDFIDLKIRTPPTKSSISQAAQLVKAECTVPPATCNPFEAVLYLNTYNYCHRALHVIVGHLITLDDEADAAEEEYRELNSEGRFWITDNTSALTVALVRDIDNLTWYVKKSRTEL
ncbi:hypothetical protein Q9L58_006573 [Maublancomyces gigas]|uniref:Uncharacterized protein n=1 Tax=Discina gigas TaxID=1032678 RepID=A0ABR3GEY9_9PEZI